MTTNAPDTTAAPIARRRLRRLAVVLLLFVLIVIGAWQTVTSSTFLTWQIRPRLETLLGGPVHIGHAGFRGGRVVLDDVELTCPDVSGPAAKAFRVDRALISLDLWRLVRGDPAAVRGLEFQAMRLRLSEDANASNVFNISSLEFANGPSGDAAPPRHVTIDSAVIEFGTHDGDQFTLAGRRWVTGNMSPHPDGDDRLRIELRETNEAGHVQVDPGVVVEGWLNLRDKELEGSFSGIALDEDMYGMCPAFVRRYWDLMGLEGRAGKATLRYGFGTEETIAAIFEVDEVELTLPFEQLWSRFQDGRIIAGVERPRMRVTSGVLRLQNDSLELERLEGTLQGSSPDDNLLPLPYIISLSVPQLPDDWNDALAVTPFEMNIELAGFSVPETGNAEGPSIALPEIVAKIVQAFNVKKMSLDSTVTVRRQFAGATSEPGAPRIEFEGSAHISNGIGAFGAFPYELDDINAEVTFDHREIVINVEGKGSGGVPIRVEGRVYPPTTMNPIIDLRLTTRGAPIDDRFRNALTPGQARLFDALLHRESYDQLRAAGMLPEDFTLGGVADLDLRIHRAEGRRQPVTLDGTISVDKVGMVYELFPYPLTVGPGVIHFGHEGLTVRSDGENAGVPVTGMYGGTGLLNGTIDFDHSRGHTRAVPNLRATVSGEPLTPLLVAAIPPYESDAENPVPLGGPRGQGAEILADLGLTGMLTVTGEITGTLDGEIDYDFGVTIEGGTANPAGELAARAGPGLRWPAGWSFRDIEGSMRVQRDVITLSRLHGENDNCALEATGLVRLGPDAGAEFRLDFDDVEIADFILNMFPPDTRPRAEAEWARYRPSGAFDAALLVNTRRDPMLELDVTPGAIGVQLGDTTTQLARAAGFLSVRKGAVRAEGLTFDVQSDARSDGRIVLDGTYIAAGAGKVELEATWSKGQLRCPVIDETVRRVLGDEAMLEYRGLSPQGHFDGNISFNGRPGGTQNDYELTINPHSLSIMKDGTPISARFDEGRVRFTPRRVDVIDVAGTHTGGSGTFGVAGHVDLGDPIRIDFDLDYRGGLASGPMTALLPPQVREALSAIDFQDGEASEVRDGRLLLTRADEPDAEWHSRFTGRVVTHDASLDVGVPLTDVSAALEVHSRYDPGQPWSLVLDTSGATFSLYDEPFTDARARVETTPAGDAILLRDVTAKLHGGAIAVDAEAGVGDHRPYTVNVVLSGVDLDRLFAEEGETPEAGNDPGTLYGRLNLSGERGRPERRRGVGRLRAMGNVASIPVGMAVIQFLQVAIPAEYRYMEADFYVAENWLTFERLLLESSIFERTTHQLIGDGGMSLDDFELDVRFRGRGGVPIVRDIMGAVSDQLAHIEVTGSLRDPVVRGVPLPSLAPPDDPDKQATAKPED